MTRAAMAGLRATHEDLRAVLSTLSDEEWQRPSGCDGWRVQDLVAHVTSNFAAMIEPPEVPADAPPPPPAEQAMELLVEPRKGWTPAQIMEEYERFAEPALAALDSMQDEPTASTEIPLADLGTYPMHQLANAYCFDHYCHLRFDLLAPHGPIERDVPPPDDLRLEGGIEWMIVGMGQMQPGQFGMVDEPLHLRLTGPGGGDWTISPPDDSGVIHLSPGTDGVATIESTAHDFVSWGTARSPWREHCTIVGDEARAAVFLDVLNII